VAVDVKSEKLTELVDPNVEIEQLATGFTFTEGPIWHPTEQVLYFSDMPADIRRKVTLDGAVTEVRKPSFKCNGMTLDADLNLIVCEHVTSSLVRERTDGVRELLAFHYGGQYLNSPNDVCVRSDGTIYFSDPWYGRFPGFGIERARELGWQGVFLIPPGGGQDELTLVVGKDEFEITEKGYYLRASPIPLGAGCVGCHTKFGATDDKKPRFAACDSSIRTRWRATTSRIGAATICGVSTASLRPRPGSD
jgi:hypothetical protein